MIEKVRGWGVKMRERERKEERQRETKKDR